TLKLRKWDRSRLEVGAWNFSGAWCLGFGVSSQRITPIGSTADLLYSSSGRSLVGLNLIYAIKQRRGSPLLAAPDSSRSRFARPKENLLHQRPLHRRGRTRLAHRPVSRRRWHRQARHR